VTKGPFYHHFQHRQAFLEAILDYWEDKFTKQFIAFSEQGLSVREKMERLQQLVVENHGNYEVNIRAWAQIDPLAREYQERVDKRRLDFLFELQKDTYENEADTRTMAQLQYSALIGSAQMIP